MRSGTVKLNDAKANGTTPFGNKQSGIGRGHGKYGFEEFLEVKSILGYNASPG
jgi:acyl-CoA reductase-like NAD-dependent aldehyde dehydrogenase